MIRRVYCMIALLGGIALTACSAADSQIATSAPANLPVFLSPTPHMAPITPSLSIQPTSIAINPPTPPPSPSPQPLPIVATDDHLMLLSDGNRLGLRARRGSIASLIWFDDSRLLTTWIDGTSSQQILYLVNLVQPDLKQLAQGSSGFQVQMNDDRSAAMILWRGEEPTSTLHAGLLSQATAQLQSVFASSPTVAQWTREQAHAWVFASRMNSLSGSWVDQHTFVLAITPEGYSLQPTEASTEWGELLLIDTRVQRVRVVGERSQLLATLSGGTLLIRQGWIDGSLQLLAAPDFVPQTITTNQAWKSAAVVSPDQQKVAWLEWSAPPGDWSRQLPLMFCCGGRDPEPQVEAIVIWDRATGQGTRMNVTGISWAWNQALLWRQDSSALIYASTTYSDKQRATAEHTTVMELTSAGIVTPLQRYSGLPLIRLGIEGGDRSLYYTLGAIGANVVDYIRLYPDGHTKVLRDDYLGTTPKFFIDSQGQVQAYVSGVDQSVILDLFTGAIIESVPQSPDRKWEWSFAEGASNSEVQIRLKP